MLWLNSSVKVKLPYAAPDLVQCQFFFFSRSSPVVKELKADHEPADDLNISWNDNLVFRDLLMWFCCTLNEELFPNVDVLLIIWSTVGAVGICSLLVGGCLHIIGLFCSVHIHLLALFPLRYNNICWSLISSLEDNAVSAALSFPGILGSLLPDWPASRRYCFSHLFIGYPANQELTVLLFLWDV